VMDKLAETEKSNTAVAAYLKVKEALAVPVSKEDVAAKWKTQGLDGYQITAIDGSRYAILHSNDNAAEVKAHSDRLDRTFKSFYYWWALRGIALPMPKERQVAVLTDKPGDFQKLHRHLTASPIFTDSFFARRESLAVFSAKRSDDTYRKLEQSSKEYWDAGFVRQLLLKGVGTRGIPRQNNVRPDQLAQTGHTPRLRALLLRALEDEWEKTSVTHEASRQLLYASGLLPRNVNVPEWLQFGMGSFFETPLQAPWGGAGSASPYWLPRFKEYKDSKDEKKKYGKTPYDVLVSVVTDSHFRKMPPAGMSPEVYKRRGRAAAWSLTYFLAQQELSGLQMLFKQLGKMPRDIELDDKVLLTTFARAFGAVNADGSLNRARLDALASRWFSFIDKQGLDGGEAVHKKIREAYAKAIRPTTPSSGNTGGFGSFTGSFAGSTFTGGTNSGGPRPGGTNTGAPPRPGGGQLGGPRPGGLRPGGR